VRELLQKGLLEKRPVLGGDAVWKEEGGTSYTLVITRLGLEMCGMSPTDVSSKNADNEAERGPTVAVSQSQQRMPRPGTKLAALVGLLSREEGTTVEEMAVATGWQQHTVRGVMSDALTRKFGLQIVSEKVEGRGAYIG
jgi:hypothetical protein